MKRIAIAILAALLVAGAQTWNEAERLLAAAKNTELVDGNMGAAIKQYGAIVSKYGKTDRAAAAAALVRMAECYRKTGDAEARKTYERVVREYPEQREAVAEARAWLGGATAPETEIGTHRVWAHASARVVGGLSPDGRYIAY